MLQTRLPNRVNLMRRLPKRWLPKKRLTDATTKLILGNNEDIQNSRAADAAAESALDAALEGPESDQLSDDVRESLEEMRQKFRNGLTNETNVLKQPMRASKPAKKS